ncbi:ABC transporter permease subunit [Bacillus sp. ISL-35]|uniref:ABC transporter permease subunit n=1 Tax=Bacillus sp. ISL-35 TaxID=2819122 RepID=UPI001BE8D942|nr:ABC transporter permease subunit [Bacillus sp. ISL-35]MBT2678535.1 ABC transporter permease subunit [Bacillus sp. ISL-35]MBT2705840.1 ABC transporter permease subunit [Chryseobacterium sp. ISL-80]
MVHFKRAIEQFVLWIVCVFLFIGILFLPVTTEYQTGQGGQFESASYHYELDKHIDNIKGFFAFIKENPDLGEFVPGESYAHRIAGKAWKSLLLIVPTLIFAYIFGVLKGIFDFRVQKRKLNFLGNGTTWLFISMPDLFFIIIIQIGLMFLYEKGLFFHVTLYGSEKLETYVVGILFLLIYPVFYLANITNVSLQEQSGNDYIRTAKSKGTSGAKILFIHILKNSFPRILAHANTITLYVLSNLFIVEKLMNFQGAADGLFNAVLRGTGFKVGMEIMVDGISAAGYTVFFASIILVSNLVTQIFKSLVTPVSQEVDHE